MVQHPQRAPPRFEPCRARRTPLAAAALQSARGDWRSSTTGRPDSIWRRLFAAVPIGRWPRGAGVELAALTVRRRTGDRRDGHCASWACRSRSQPARASWARSSRPSAQAHVRAAQPRCPLELVARSGRQFASRLAAIGSAGVLRRIHGGAGLLCAPFLQPNRARPDWCFELER